MLCTIYGENWSKYYTYNIILYTRTPYAVKYRDRVSTFRLTIQYNIIFAKILGVGKEYRVSVLFKRHVTFFRTRGKKKKKL